STSATRISKRTSERQSSEPTMSLVANASSLPQYSHGEDDVDDAEDGVDNSVRRKFVHFEDSDRPLVQNILRCKKSKGAKSSEGAEDLPTQSHSSLQKLRSLRVDRQLRAQENYLRVPFRPSFSLTMGSRPDKAPAEPLAVTGRYKPMKVVKIKRARTNRVKQGAPPKLSISQMRKLVRLYILTKLPWKYISTLVLHYGNKQVEKRGLQYILKGLLSAQYKQMRPKDTATRRKRDSEIRRCTELEPLQRHPHEEVKLPSKKAASRSVPDTKVSAGSSATFETVGEVEFVYSNDFDRYIDDQEKMIHARDPQSSSRAICGTPGTCLAWLDEQIDLGMGRWNPNCVKPREPLTSQSSHHQILPQKSRQITADPTVPPPQSLPKSDVNLLVDQLSICSLGEKSFIKHNLEQYSVATTATKTIRSRSEPSISSGQIGENPESRIPAVIEGLAQAVEATFSGGIFWNHIVSEIVQDPQQFRLAYCEGLCLSERPNSSRTGEVGTPLPIALQHARQLIFDVWSGATMSGWVDRFGNTSLHIAAFCGASLPHLLCLMEHVDVNSLNNAGQTFMHVLDPRSMSPEDMIALRDQLILDGFIFHYRDVEGQTFLDTLKHGGIKQSDFARCWLRPIIRKDRPFHGFSVETTSEQLLDGRLVRKIFKEIGGHEKQWKMLGWTSNSYQHLHCSSNVNELLEPSYNPMLLKTKDCWDRLGRGLLHIAADDMAGPATPTEAQQRRSNAMRLNLVKHLLSIGVDVNHHDDEGVTPLMAHVRCETYQHAIVDELLQHGAGPNARDSSGNTALHIAIKLGNMDATKILLGRGANVHARNRNCEGLLTVAKRAQRSAKDDVGLYAKTFACTALIIDAGAIASPNLFHEWDPAQMNGSYDTHGSNSSRTRPVFLDPVSWGSEFGGNEW
ncbi:MAG: hypothetical protein LQ349_008178, partial [Xanthoria aureola]